MNDMSPIKFGKKSAMGENMPRVEDERFVKGAGFYPTDHMPEGTLEAHVVRSLYASADFTINNKDDVAALPGVHMVLSHEDIADMASLPCLTPLGEDENGTPYQQPPRYPLAKGRARFVGDPIAFIVADTKAIAAEAAEQLDIDFDALDPVVGIDAATQDGAPQVWPDFPANNMAAEAQVGDKAAAQAALAAADHVVELKIVNHRVVCNYMEPRACVVEYDSDEDVSTLTVGSQGVFSIRTKLNGIMGIDMDKIRVITPDVGGGFGTKLLMYHEYPLCIHAAKSLNKPVRWVCDRTEHFIADNHGRDNITTARLGLDKNGKFVGLDVKIYSDVGAYLSDFSTIIQWFGASMATGVYDIKDAFAHVVCVYTNTTTTDAYRGAGRPEAAYLVERLVDYAALKVGIDRVELRRINFIKPDQFPYTTHAGRKYDVGEFDGHMTRAMDVSGWDAFSTRRAQSEATGKIRGIGLATYIEACAFAGSEPAFIDLNDDGTVTLRIGTQSTGQGHATAYAQFISDQLNLPMDQINVHQGDTNELSSGGGTGGSRSIPIGGVSVNGAAIDLSSKIKEIASDKLEVSSGDLELIDGTVTVVGTDRKLTFSDIAEIAEEPLIGEADVAQDEATYPNGTHVCELEIDPNTGIVEILNYTVVDDFGVTVNPALLEGQVHGGIVQGIGQAFHERVVYDDSGQLLTASFMDYGMPRADDFPNFHFETRNVPSTTNALGIKGAGEAGSIGSTPAVMNALVDALHNSYGIEHLDMPALPQVVWQAIQDTK